MMKFLKYMLATITGIFISTIILVLIFFGIISAIVSSTKDKQVFVKENTVLHIKLDKEITDRASNNPFEGMSLLSMKPETKLGLTDILENLEKAKSDPNIKGIYLDVSAVEAGPATIEEIRNALLDFKTSKKFIISYADYYTQGAYYLASVADKIYLNPQGLIEFKGLNAELMFYKGAIEKLGIEPQVIRHGKFKSAIEPFILDKMSPENREQTMTYMKSIWDHFIKGVSVQRSISVEDLNLYADSMTLRNAKIAVELKMADGVKYKDEIIAELKQLSGIAAEKELEIMSIGKYTNAPKTIDENKKIAKDRIAVIYATGQIDMGKGDSETIGSDGISEAIRKARLDKNVKAVVLRINSPGGSALASEVILREVILTKKVKPVIASMGDVAASGGYYIACAADTIIASPTTITGSIGVFGLMFNGKKLMNEKLGLTVDVVKTNAHSDIGTQFRAMTNDERNVIQHEVEQIYDVFITHVSEGRKIPKEQVDSVGQGRVWSGENALGIKLIDTYGGLNEAIKIAARMAKITDYRIKSLPEQKEPFEQIMEQLSGDASVSVIRKELGENYKYYKGIQNVLRMRGVQARLPYDIDIY
ncbi:MAG: signal peptide peptidase SppA [Bacteroidetes bacterium RIFOXYA12_FULL_35_11]|nr:MAG: signal peptide peptidase SppA [Bacteroidetes bacterium GWF2_35_48]OFY82409.1 MAG: signal peptide peptidase SppA [Bacteroidetes bacterium RIFOXYA12_FULL_35_11]OFY92604.1 MAG: signal peptide peptidase SppA [Bacteroidetes bacterium RIFOXYC12_FULL_35_7]OFY95541.1 MAG: signal peptide peptidase SppA [Bacteroidetes bacterium RIFOXYB2_FULL_35_7]HBX51879.1 signal peptide peptidase SppA [Bacteroidales bacterium]